MRKGFTLIEVLVSIAIIGIMAAIVFGVLAGGRESARMAQAKSDARQLMNAAALVFAEYGYYPNDSHGSIICPRDIVIDSDTGRTWGDFINLCEDPWGNPYEWNNQCAGGGVRKPHAPFDPTCGSFSHSNQGPIGVTVVGENATNDNCTSDDICYGEKGHPIYGGGGSGNGDGGEGGDPEPTQACVSTIASCDALSPAQCDSRTGCSLGDASCAGTYSASCSSFGDMTSCGAQTGCSWTTGGGSCGGTPTVCSAYGSDSTSCSNAGCNIVPASCQGSYSCSTWNGTSASTCTANPGCTWNKNKCNGGTLSCSSLSTAACTPTGCSISDRSCSGTPSTCTTYSSQTSCSQAGCTWTPSGVCDGNFDASCGTYNANQTACENNASCSWGGAACTGAANSCGANTTEAFCIAEAGCTWQ